MARVSTQSKTQDTSNARQLESLRAYADRMGWIVVGQGEERISGGKGEADRPELARAMSAIRGLLCDCLIVTRLDRLGRSVRHVLDVCDELEKFRCGLVVAEMASLSWTDTNTPHGRFLLQVFAALAELYRADYAERSVAAIRSRQAKGLKCGRKPSVLIPPDAVAWALSSRRVGRSWSWLAVHALEELGSSYAYSVAAWRRALGSAMVPALPEVGVDLPLEMPSKDIVWRVEGFPCQK